MAHEFIGKIIFISACKMINTQKGERKTWECTMQYDLQSQYPHFVAFSIWDENIFNTVATFYGNGEMNVRISCDVDAKEYNGRWFNNIRCFRAELAQPYPQVGQPMPQQQQMGGYPQPQMQQGYNPQPQMQQGYNQPMQQPVMQQPQMQQQQMGFTAPVAPQPTIPNAGVASNAPQQGYSNGTNAVGDDDMPF